ncbi:DUF4982 domain-containing protein [Mucilaginibacter sp. RS28]|uniref:DUF4982 domain-containing protein n=1 Tax=Mucilaginibacter straminoryzae TaxID=2932774 RepID=A0A9X2BAS1_9SPHI|nr:glycoside hydrolase family 2 TIM barrel-domain containing protein [Mucilaginibacter straminoryzae]MCJ8211065.1 DUF4982 domain-containing protein [Mucilaginibacter straminoryzae]
MRNLIKIFLITGLLLTGNLSQAQQSIRLNQGWQFLREDLGGIWEAVRPTNSNNPENVPLWQKVTLPHCFNAEDAVDPDHNYYQGPGWYRTRLSISNPHNNGRTLLHFEGAGQKTQVYVYTTLVGSHVGGYDEWTVDITDAVDAFKKTAVFQKQFKGQVPISIRCDNSRDLESMPSRLSDFMVYGGLYRYVNLVYTPALSIDKVFASSSLSDHLQGGKLDIKATFYNPDKVSSASGNFKITDAKGKIIADQKFNLKAIQSEVKFSLGQVNIKKPNLWSLNDPYLYAVEVTLQTSEGVVKQTEKVGFRDFLFADNGPFYLNGKRLLLRGTHRHEDHAGLAAAETDSIMRLEMQMIKDMGANFIRLGHYQQSRTILNLCDSLGILVWEEEPWCRGGLGGPVYQEQGRRMLTNMIEQHYNHPSIILWGLGNENDWEGDFQEFDQQKIRDYMSSQNNLAHQLDPSRKTTIRRCDFCKDIPDVYSPSIWAGWYRGQYTDYRKIAEEESKKVKHFFHAEWGGDSHAGRFSENADKAVVNLPDSNVHIAKENDWSENYITNLFDWHLKEQEKMPWLTGSAFWVFKDFATPVRPENPVPNVNQKGVVERDLTKKESYYVFQSYWSAKPMVHLFGHNWPVRWGKAGEQKLVKVYSNCDEAELFVNRKSYGKKQRNSQNFPAAGLHWMIDYQQGDNLLIVKARKDKLILTDTIYQQYQTEKWGKPVKLVLKKIAGKEGKVTVQAMLLDADNRLCLDAVNVVAFSLAGDGKLLDNLGTSRGSRKLQVYNGRAIISVDTNNGKSVIGVQSTGIESAFLNL